MKNKYFISILFSAFISVCIVFAQPYTYGVYRSAEDYKNKKLSIEINCGSSNDKIKLHHFFSKKYIDVIQNGQKSRLYKDSIFGYRDAKQKSYRFYKDYDREYEILENESIVLYRIYVSVPNSNGKTYSLVPNYFFSTSLSDAILPLSILNLKRAFPDNLKFHDRLDIVFGDGTPISEYDAENKMYKVNFLLNQ